MADKLGALFINAALGPVSYAGTCIMQHRVKAGLAELHAENLMGGVRRGVHAVATTTGVPEAHVMGLLPMARVQALGQRIAEHQATAAQQWDVHTGHIGGLLEGVANLTDDGRPPNTTICLRRLATKMALDKALAQPLSNLADDLDRWHALMDTCRAVIDDGQSLSSAYRQKQLVRWGLVIALLLSFTAGGVWAFRVFTARARIDERLAAANPCDVAGADASDLAKATDDQRAAIADKARACKEAKEAEQKREEQERAAAEDQARKEREAKEAAERCGKLAASVENGAGPSDGEHVAMLQRIAKGQLDPADVTTDLSKFSCGEGDAGTRIGTMLGRAVLAHSGKWIRDQKMSEGVAALVARGRNGLADKQKAIFAAGVERLATEAVNMGDDDLLGKVVVLCRLTEQLEQPQRQMCAAALQHGK